jgi:hypothetical protein
MPGDGPAGGEKAARFFIDSQGFFEFATLSLLVAIVRQLPRITKIGQEPRHGFRKTPTTA